MQMLQHARSNKQRMFEELEAFQRERDLFLSSLLDNLEHRFEDELQKTPLGEVSCRPVARGNVCDPRRS
jgi:hypothetical protein